MATIEELKRAEECVATWRRTLKHIKQTERIDMNLYPRVKGNYQDGAHLPPPPMLEDPEIIAAIVAHYIARGEKEVAAATASLRAAGVEVPE